MSLYLEQKRKYCMIKSARTVALAQILIKIKALICQEIISHIAFRWAGQLALQSVGSFLLH